MTAKERPLCRRRIEAWLKDYPDLTLREIARYDGLVFESGAISFSAGIRVQARKMLSELDARQSALTRVSVEGLGP